MKKKLIVLTGAGISAESGLKTFRDVNGLWEGYNVMEVVWFETATLGVRQAAQRLRNIG